jgi:hypothetical protein
MLSDHVTALTCSGQSLSAVVVMDDDDAGGSDRVLIILNHRGTLSFCCKQFELIVAWLAYNAKHIQLCNYYVNNFSSVAHRKKKMLAAT